MTDGNTGGGLICACIDQTGNIIKFRRTLKLNIHNTIGYDNPLKFKMQKNEWQVSCF